MLGGSIVKEECSHIGHIFRSQNPIQFSTTTLTTIATALYFTTATYVAGVDVRGIHSDTGMLSHRPHLPQPESHPVFHYNVNNNSNSFIFHNSYVRCRRGCAGGP